MAAAPITCLIITKDGAYRIITPSTRKDAEDYLKQDADVMVGWYEILTVMEVSND